MAAIRWVCISDLHLGALNSVLTSVTEDGLEVDRKTSSLAMSALAPCIRSLGAGQEDLPELVVLGDLFELALISTDMAAASFGQFVAALRIGRADAAVAPLIRFIPGNHDHRLWTQARDANYLEYLRSDIGDDTALSDAHHATHLMPERQRLPVRDRFVELLAARADSESKIVVEQNYPNLGMVSGDGRKAVVLSHGHFVEPLYRLMSNLDVVFGRSPDERLEAWHIEADNASWIDFFWSSMGDSGDVTGIVRSLYESLQSEEAINAEIVAIGQFVARTHPGIRGRFESRLISSALRKEVAKRLHRERHRPDATLSAGAEKGLEQFLRGPVLLQLRHFQPTDTTFVFGHTHKPFVESRPIEGYPNPISVVNTGGWVVDSVAPDSKKGAAVIVVDEDANVAVLRCYTEGSSPESYRVVVASGDEGIENPLVDQLGASIDPSRDPWLALGGALSTAVKTRGRQLAYRLASSEASLSESTAKKGTSRDL